MGEKLDQIEPFHPDRMAGRILGMGDVLSLIEKAEQRLRREEGGRAGRAAQAEQVRRFTDYYDQLQQLKDMGSMDDIAGDAGHEPQPAQGQRSWTKSATAHMEAIVRRHDRRRSAKTPAILGNSRKKRIAAGSGTTVMEVNRLLKQYDMMLAALQADERPRRQEDEAHGQARRLPGLGGMGGGMGFPGM